MSKAALSVGLLLLGVIALVIINVISNYATGGEVDFYLLKETTSSAMEDSLDEVFFATNGVPRMDKEKFMESFLRRFADNVNTTRDYKIGFYGINEVPPKVSVKVNSLTTVSYKGESANITTTINELMEMTKTGEDKWLEKEAKSNKSIVGADIILQKRKNKDDKVKANYIYFKK